MSEGTLAKLVERTPAFVVGVVLLLISAAGGVPMLGIQIGDSLWRVAVGVVGVALILLGGALLVRESPQQRSPSLGVDVDYGIRIVSPRDGAHVPRHAFAEVSGSYVRKPKPGTLAVFNVSLDGRQFWPQDPVLVDDIRPVWTTRSYINGDTEIMVATVGAPGRVLSNYYRKVGAETNQWPAIDELPDDVVPRDRVSVVAVDAPP